MRLDIFLVERNFCKSRAAAQRLIDAGGVLVNGAAAVKNSLDVGEGDEVSINEALTPKFVGRGGEKLEFALKRQNIALCGKVCLDVGASTGGFTDCMLKNGAERVYAVDVGTAQLCEELRADSRVISLEQTDIRDFSLEEYENGCKADFIAADVSFISLKLILPHIARLLKRGGRAVVLIKPQFEAGRKNLSKRGVVTSEKVRRAVVEDIKQFAAGCGFSIIGTDISPIKGGSGNTEYLLTLGKEI